MVWDSSRTNFDRNLAVVIGINQYQNGIARLNTAKPDAEKFAELLEKNYQYQVELLTDDTKRKPTLKELVTLLTQELPQRLQTPTEVNRLIVYFAGHGMPLESDEGPRGFLLPQDANPNPQLGETNNFLSMQVLHDALIALPCHHLLIILDCCFAGTFRWATTRKLIPIPETLHREHYDRFIRYPAWQVITSAAHDQEALDFLSDKRGISDKTKNQTIPHSPFAEALFAALEAGKPDEKGIHHKQGDLTKDGVITASELYLYLRDSVETRSGERQTPGIYPLKKHDRGEYIFHDPDFNPNSLSEAPPLDHANNPYRGLKPFEEKHARFFFGRQELIENLYKCIILPNHPLTVVLGVSGSGKSSLVKAGLIPFLRQDKTQTWQILPPMRPGESPFAALAKMLLPIVDVIPELPHSTQPESEQATSPDFLNTLSQQLQFNPDCFIELIQTWSQQHPDAHLLLLIDQFEELITLARNPQPENQADSPDDTQQFLNLLETAIAADLPQLRIIVTLRSDFEPRFLNSDTLKSHWTQARFPVRAMRSDELRQSIEGPASEMALYFEPANLVDRLIDEVGQMPGALPLLSFTLSELYIELAEKWRKRQTSDRALTIDAEFDREGGVAGSLTRRANEEYDKLVKNVDTKDKYQGGFGKEEGKAYQVTIRRIMLRMLTLEGGETARRRVPDSELIYPTPEESDRVKAVVNRLVNARLLVRGQLETGEPYVEPAHDFLVRGWGMLQDWINEEKTKETLELQQRLTAQANDWYGNNRPSGLLLQDGNRLNQLEKILNFYNLDNNWLNQQEIEFVQSSIAYRDAQEKQSKELRLKAKLQQNANRIENYLLNTQSLEALTLAIQSMGENLDNLPNLLLTSIQSSLQKAMAMGRMAIPFQERESPINSIAFSPISQIIVSCSYDQTVRCWDLQDNPVSQPFLGQESSVNSVAFSPDGQKIAGGCNNGTVCLWNLKGNLIDQPFQGHKRRVTSVAFSPNGQRIVSCSPDETVYLWNLQSNLNREPFQVSESSIFSVAFDPDGQGIVGGGSEGIVRLWDLQGNLIPGQSSSKHEGAIISVTFSPNGQMIASGGQDSTVRLWDWQGNPIGQPFRGHKHSVTSVKFSPDGQSIISSSLDGTVRLWNLQGDLINRPLQEQKNSLISSIAISPDGQVIVSSGFRSVDGNNKGSISLWDLRSNSIGQAFRRHEHPVSSLAFSPDGQTIMSGGFGAVYLWNLQGNFIGQLHESPNDYATSLTFNPDAQTVTIFTGDGTVILKDVKGNFIEEVFQKYERDVSSAAFQPDGGRIVSSLYCGTIYLWDSQGNSVSEFSSKPEASVTLAALSWDGQKLVLGSFDGTIYLCDLQGNLTNSPFRAHDSAISAVAFSPDGQMIVSGGEDKTVRLWDLQGNLIGQPFQGHESHVTAVAFSPDGQVIASGGEDKTIRLWRGNWKSWLQVCCDRLRYHPVFTNPESIEDPEQRELAIAACETCKKYVWNASDRTVVGKA